MIRRSFRLGLTLGLLAGAALALVKMLGGRSGPTPVPAPAPSAPWPPLPTERPTTWVPSEAGAPPAAPVEPAIAPEAPAPPAAARPVKKAPLKAAAPAPKAAKKAPLKAAPKPAKAAAKAPAAKRSKAAAPTWVVPEGDVCPTGYPVKARLSSGIFHVPGMLNYLRTRPDRCYRDAEAAEADGLRAAKR